MKTVEKFWASVAVGGEDSCWEWQRGLDSRGYGHLRWMDRAARAHRVAYELAKGAIPPGEGPHGTIVMHGCDNKRCCNPKHLTLGNHAANMGDMREKGRRKGIGTGADNGRAKLTIEQVQAIRMDTRGKRKIAPDYGISPAQVQRIRLGLQWASP